MATKVSECSFFCWIKTLPNSGLIEVTEAAKATLLIPYANALLLTLISSPVTLWRVGNSSGGKILIEVFEEVVSSWSTWSSVRRVTSFWEINWILWRRVVAGTATTPSSLTEPARGTRTLISKLVASIVIVPAFASILTHWRIGRVRFLLLTLPTSSSALLRSACGTRISIFFIYTPF